MIDCLSESDDEDDVEIISPVTQTSDDPVDSKSDHVSNSDSSFSQLDDDDDDLSADTTGEFIILNYVVVGTQLLVKLYTAPFY